MARRSILLAGAITMVACSARPGPQVPAAPVSPAAAPVADVPEEPADDRVAVSGRLRAHDGSALRMGEVEVRRNGFEKPLLAVALEPDGTFHAKLAPGAYTITIAAVDHANVRLQTVVTGELRVEGELGTYARVKPEGTIRIHAEYLDGTGKSIGAGPTEAKLVEGADSVYRLDLSQRPEGATRVRYELGIGGGRTLNGPVADAYESDHGGDFWSVVDLAKKDAIDLDLRELPPAGKEASLAWTGESPSVAAVRAYRERWSARLDALTRKVPRKDGKLLVMTAENRAEQAALFAEALAEVEGTKDAALRDLLRAAYIAAFVRFATGVADDERHRENLAWIVDHVDPADIHLALLPSLDYHTAAVVREADDDLVARTEAWLDRRARENPDPAVAAQALDILIDEADRRRDDARIAELYRLATDPRFEGTYYRKFIEQQYDPDRILQRGKPLPAFDFVGLDADGGRITSADLAGRVYLLEFWATWCGPCVSEMPKLHEVYAEINGARRGKGRGDAGLRRLRKATRPKVEFVFVSLDAQPANVEAFRREHWSMPWTHAFVGRTADKDVMKQFGFSGVPTAILVDESGTILEVDEALHREALLPTLERALAERSAQP